jgi:hypothetical protein
VRVRFYYLLKGNSLLKSRSTRLSIGNPPKRDIAVACWPNNSPAVGDYFPKTTGDIALDPADTINEHDSLRAIAWETSSIHCDGSQNAARPTC